MMHFDKNLVFANLNRNLKINFVSRNSQQSSFKANKFRQIDLICSANEFNKKGICRKNNAYCDQHA